MQNDGGRRQWRRAMPPLRLPAIKGEHIPPEPEYQLLTMHAESRWEAAVAAITASSAAAGARASPPVKAHAYPRPSVPPLPAASSPLRSCYTGVPVAAAEQQRQRQQQRRQRHSESSGSSSGSDSPSADGSIGSEGGSARRESLTPPLDLGLLRQAGKQAQEGLGSRQKPSAAQAASAPAAGAADGYIPAHQGAAAASSGAFGGSGAGGAASAAGGAVQQRRSAAGMATRAMGRQLRGMRDAAVAAASPRVSSAALAASSQQQQQVHCIRNGVDTSIQ